MKNTPPYTLNRGCLYIGFANVKIFLEKTEISIFMAA